MKGATANAKGLVQAEPSRHSMNALPFQINLCVITGGVQTELFPLGIINDRIHQPGGHTLAAQMLGHEGVGDVESPVVETVVQPGTVNVVEALGRNVVAHSVSVRVLEKMGETGWTGIFP